MAETKNVVVLKGFYDGEGRRYDLPDRYDDTSLKSSVNELSNKISKLTEQLETFNQLLSSKVSSDQLNEKLEGLTTGDGLAEELENLQAKLEKKVQDDLNKLGIGDINTRLTALDTGLKKRLRTDELEGKLSPFLAKKLDLSEHNKFLTKYGDDNGKLSELIGTKLAIGDLDTKLEDCSRYKGLFNRLGAAEGNITGFNTRFEAVDVEIGKRLIATDLNGKLLDCQNFNNKLTLSELNSKLADCTAFTALGSRLNTAEGTLGNYGTRIGTCESNHTNFLTTYGNDKTALEGKIKTNADSLGAFSTRVGSVETSLANKLDNTDSAFQTMLGKNAEFTGLKSDVETNVSNYSALAGRVGTVETTHSDFVTQYGKDKTALTSSINSKVPATEFNEYTSRAQEALDGKLGKNDTAGFNTLLGGNQAFTALNSTVNGHTSSLSTLRSDVNSNTASLATKLEKTELDTALGSSEVFSTLSNNVSKNTNNLKNQLDRVSMIESNTGSVYRGMWSGDGVTYNKGDIVECGVIDPNVIQGQVHLFACLQSHTSSQENYVKLGFGPNTMQTLDSTLWSDKGLRPSDSE